VKDALITEGINSDRIVLVSFGESNPLCTTKTKDCWKLNRRVENKILP
jgi:peptidoglycan-associated lipoprotein